VQVDDEFRYISMLQDKPGTSPEAEAKLERLFVPLTQEIWAIQTEQQRQVEHIAALENRLQALTQILVLFPEQFKRLGSGVELQLSQQKEISECTERDLKSGLENIKAVLSRIQLENQNAAVLNWSIGWRQMASSPVQGITIAIVILLGIRWFPPEPSRALNQQLQILYQQTELLGNSQKRHK
jgi:hypothetical protein